MQHHILVTKNRKNVAVYKFAEKAEIMQLQTNPLLLSVV